jgi:hypothetical protein
MEREWRNRCIKTVFFYWKSFESAAKNRTEVFTFLWAEVKKGIRITDFYFSNQWNLLNLRWKIKHNNQILR